LTFFYEKIGAFDGGKKKMIVSRMLIRTLVPGLVLMIVTLKSFAETNVPLTDSWIDLFNGKNLDGWTPKIRYQPYGENYKNTFRANQGVIRVSYDEYEHFDNRFGHLFYEMHYSNYRLRLEYRFTGDQLHDAPKWAFRNSGVMVHGQSGDSMRLDQDFPVSIEVQLLGGDGINDRPTGNLCTPGTHVVMQGILFTPHCVNSVSATFHGDQWVNLEIIVRGNTVIKHIINDDEVLSYEQPQIDPAGAMVKIKPGSTLKLSGGSISLQSEGHPVEFRNIQLLILDQ
jgi:hypothetical protein